MVRSASLDETENDKLLKDKDSENTQKATKMAVKVFCSYLQDKGLSPEFEALVPADLDSVLCKFYAEARTISGELYKRSTLFSIRHGLNRYLSVNLPNPATKELKRIFKERISPYPPIEKNDLKLFYQYFDLENNIKLQEKVFLDIVLYFGRCGRENLHLLRISEFSARHDAKGHLYIYLDKDKLKVINRMQIQRKEGCMQCQMIHFAQ